MGSDRTPDREFEEALGKLIGALILAALALYAYPQSLGAFIGCFAASCYPTGFDDRADRRYWQGLAGWSIGAALAVGGAYLVLASPIGADAQWRRFDRKWGPGSLDVSALVEHPWAWLPLASAAALVGFGAAILWRAR